MLCCVALGNILALSELQFYHDNAVCPLCPWAQTLTQPHWACGGHWAQLQLRKVALDYGRSPRPHTEGLNQDLNSGLYDSNACPVDISLYLCTARCFLKPFHGATHLLEPASLPLRGCRSTATSVVSGVKPPDFTYIPDSIHIPTDKVCDPGYHFISLSFGFPVCQMGLITTKG